MTTSFENFLKQYEKTGSEKADGYSRDVFVGLSESEKERVFALLLKELPFSAKWLFFLDAKKALPFVIAEEKRLRGNEFAHAYQLQEELIEHTGDLSYQTIMIETYHNYISRLKPLVVDAIARTPPNLATISFLKSVILADGSSDAVSRAAWRLVSVLNIPRTNEAEESVYKQMVTDLRNESLDVKLRALKQLDRYEVNQT